MHKILEKDSRKWVLFNNQLGNYQNLYELYTSVETKKSKGSVLIQESEDAGNSKLIIDQVGYDVSLEIEGEAARKRFLEYLVQNYFSNEEIEDWYASKVIEKEKIENHYVSPLTSAKQEKLNFKTHPKEIRYYKLRVFFSVCFYIALLGLVGTSFMTSLFSGVLTTSIILGLALCFALIKRIAQGFFIGLVKGSSVRLNDHQYPEIYKIVKEQATQIGLKEIPDVYVTYGHFNAFVTKYARKKYLILCSEVLETASKGDYEVLKIVIGHEIGHLKRQHLNRETWLTPSSFIPLLKQAHSRGCEYTCDRIGYHFSAKGAVEGILVLATGKEIYSKINTQRYIEDSNSDKSFWVWMSEKFLSHPHAFKRMTAISNYAKRRGK